MDTGRFIDCNDAAVRLHETGTRENFLGLTPDRLSPKFQPNGESSHKLSMEHIKKTITEGSNVFEWIHVKYDGTPFPALVTLSAMTIGSRKLVLAVGRDLTDVKQAAAKREQLIDELKEALGKIKTLKGLFPICASCKKIRDDQGYWNQIEEYIRDRSDAKFSHGICPECAKKLYPDFYKKDK